MAKEVAAFIKLQIKGGAANPSPPVGPALGSKGVNIMDFCKQFNARTQDKAGKVLPVIITVYSDKSFDFRRAERVGLHRIIHISFAKLSETCEPIAHKRKVNLRLSL